MGGRVITHLIKLSEKYTRVQTPAIIRAKHRDHRYSLRHTYVIKHET